MTLYELFLGDYKIEPIASPLLYHGKAVGLLLDGGHGIRQYTAGKRSPDGRLIEGEWNREMVARTLPDYRAIGIDARCLVPEDEDISLAERVRRANNIAAREPDKVWFYHSYHINAAGGKGWNANASGFCAYASPGGSLFSQQWAYTSVQTAKQFGFLGNRAVPPIGYWQKAFYVIKNTKMPAILTENLFMTNRDEVDFLLSENGKRQIASMHLVTACKMFGVPHAVAYGKR